MGCMAVVDTQVDCDQLRRKQAPTLVVHLAAQALLSALTLPAAFGRLVVVGGRLAYMTLQCLLAA